MCVLGSMMLDSNSIPIARELLSIDDFFRPEHQILWQHMISRDDKIVDLVLLREKLENDGNLEKVGGIQYIVSLVEGVPSAANIKYYAGIVRDKSRGRKLLSIANKISNDAFDNIEPDEIIKTAQTAMLDFLSDAQNFYSIGQAASCFVTDAEESMSGGQTKGLSYYIPDLDFATGRLLPGEMVILAGKPGTGKTSMVMTVVLNLCRAGYNGIVINAEMSSKQLAGRVTTAIASVDGNEVRRGKIDESELQRLKDAEKEVADFKLMIIDRACTIEEISMHVRKWRHNWGQVDFVVVDYIQQMKTPGNKSRYEAVTDMARGLKDIALVNNVGMYALAALRKVDDRRPTNEDLKDSGEIEYAADQIILLHQPEPVVLVRQLHDPPVLNVYPVWAKVSKDREGSQTPWPDMGKGQEFGIRLRFCKASKLFLPEPRR